MGGRRHNVYIVWLTPKTKVCETTQKSGTSEHAKKEVMLDKLEVGDRVEVQFAPAEDSVAHNNVHQSQQIRQKHGCHRTHVGYATEITILPSREHAQLSSGSGAKSNEGSKSLMRCKAQGATWSGWGCHRAPRPFALSFASMALSRWARPPVMSPFRQRRINPSPLGM
jgi:hypothetical protein